MNRETTAVRQGEELDREALSAFLERSGLLATGDLTIEQFPGGSSNLTYLLRRGDAEIVLRRPPFGNVVRSAHDMRREFSVLSRLSKVYSPAPKPLVFCDDASVIGSDFYLMERLHGLIIRGRLNDAVDRPVLKVEAEKLNNSQPYRELVCRSFIENLAHLHALDHKAAGLSDLGSPEGYPRRQIEGWTKRYVAAKTHEYLQLEQVNSWLNANIPKESGASLIHNDYKFDNVMLDPEDLSRITGVLDWEMVTIGDPLMDLGTTLGYWMSPDEGGEMLGMPFNPGVLMANISRQQLVEMYTEASGRDTSNIFYYYVFGLFKIAVIAQQIYARYARGFTKDERFASYPRIVGSLGSIAFQAIESNG